ncbi:MAG TPA: ABC transporter ATP-binding protein [Firmicutes bacterium]|nr:ABC transporter ATP-binding protein [Bacillota bacterium]
MQVKWPLPETIACLVAERLPHGEEIIISLATDMAIPDQYVTGWLVATHERIMVFRPQQTSEAWHIAEYPIRDVKWAKVDPLVGGGRLQFLVGLKLIEALYFSSSLTERFAEAARMIEKLAKGEDPGVPAAEEAKRCSKCRRLLPEPGGLCPACVRKVAVFMRIAGYMKPYWPSALALAVVALASTGARLVPPRVTRMLIDRVLLGQETGLLIWLILALLGVYVAEALAGLTHSWIVAALSAKVTRDIRAHIYRTLERLTLRFYDKRQIGAIMSRVTTDSDRLQGLLVDGLPYLLSNIVLIVGVAVVLLIHDWWLALLALVPAPLLVLGGAAFWKHLRQSWYTWSQKWSNFSAYLNESITGIKVVKAFAQEVREISRLDQRNEAVCQIGTRADRLWFTFFTTMNFTAGIGFLLVYFFGARRVLAGEITAGELIMFTMYQTILYGPLQWISQLNNWMTRALAGAERIFEVIDSQPEPYQDPKARHLEDIAGKVEFRGVIFGYERYKPVLKNINLNVKPGEMIGLVGRSGVGKSTLINLLCRLYDPDEGEILLDGVNLKEIRLDSLRSRIGMVLQEPFLFNGTIAENIAYGKPDATREEIVRAARAANAHNFIVNKPDGYDTQVGERGTKLSVGERQRISIARAILHDPKILIMDEATASVDTETERQIQEAIARLVKGRTTFAIAHRLSTLRNADRLVVLDDGKIAEIGTHDELLVKKGIYYRLVNMQAEINKTRAIDG